MYSLMILILFSLRLVIDVFFQNYSHILIILLWFKCSGSYGSGSMRDLRDSVGSQDGLMTARSGVKDVVKRPSKAGMGVGHPSTAVYGRQISEPVTQEEQDTVTVNGEKAKTKSSV